MPTLGGRSAITGRTERPACACPLRRRCDDADEPSQGSPVFRIASDDGPAVHGHPRWGSTGVRLGVPTARNGYRSGSAKNRPRGLAVEKCKRVTNDAAPGQPQTTGLFQRRHRDQDRVAEFEPDGSDQRVPEFLDVAAGSADRVAAVITAVGSIYLATSGATANAAPAPAPAPSSSAATTPALDTTQLDSVRNSATSADQALITSCAGGDANSCTLVVTGLQQECSQGLAVSCTMLNVLFPFG